MVELITLIGLAGSVTASCLFFPQVWQSYKTKMTKDISWFGIFVGMLNGILWVSYGLIKADPFLYVTNSILFIGAFFLGFLKKKYDTIPSSPA